VSSEKYIMKLLHNVMTVLSWCALSVATASTSLQADEISVISSNNMRELITGAQSAFEASSGHKLKIIYGNAPSVAQRVRAGENFDVVLIQKEALLRLASENRVSKDSIRDIAKSAIGIFGKKGRPSFVLQAAEDAKNFLLTAKSISYPNPAKGVLGGVVEQILARLQIAEILKDRIRLADDTADLVKLIAAGEVEIGISQVTRAATNTLSLLATLPAATGGETVLSAAVINTSSKVPPATSLISFLASPNADAAVAGAGLMR
jgi:molybdate transport system substrate-binding protein